MVGSAPSPPPPPDPAQTANAQGFENVNAALAQAQLNDINQVTPYGSITYTSGGPGTWIPNLPTGGGGAQWTPADPADTLSGQMERAHPNQTFIPQYTATTTLSPEMQRLFNTTLGNAQTSADTASALGKNVQSMLSKNVDLGPGSIQAYLDKLNRQTLDPQFEQAQTALNQQLADQGLTPGSEGWKFAQTQFGLNKANTYNNMYLQGQNTATQNLLAMYNEPLNALDALKSGAQVSQPGIGTLAPTPQEQVQPAPYAQSVWNNAQNATSQFNAQTAAHAQEMGGLFGLGGSLLGAVGGLSDRGDKTDIQKLGENDGLPIYAYRYKDDPKSYPKSVGPMAQDVEKAMPGSTFGIGAHRVIRNAA
jgi:hypothetical protein